MKLIIDIPKDVYEDILKHSTEIQAEGYVIASAVLHGTPLDDVKIKIANIDSPYRDGCWVKASVWKILDNIGKESEDT
jgi:hypothetical protein